jgi:hypothetical protein
MEALIALERKMEALTELEEASTAVPMVVSALSEGASRAKAGPMVTLAVTEGALTVNGTGLGRLGCCLDVVRGPS